MNVLLNVSGCHFEVQKDILFKIPYFENMINDSGGSLNEVIFVARPSHIFKHILAYMIDPLYPYPKKNEFELKFYGVEYNMLYDSNEEILDKINILEYKINSIDTKLCKLERKIKKIKNKMSELPDLEGTKNFTCYRCSEPAENYHNYCSNCIDDGYKCNKRGCEEDRTEYGIYCTKHH